MQQMQTKHWKWCTGKLIPTKNSTQKWKWTRFGTSKRLRNQWQWAWWSKCKWATQVCTTERIHIQRMNVNDHQTRQIGESSKKDIQIKFLHCGRPLTQNTSNQQVNSQIWMNTQKCDLKSSSEDKAILRSRGARWHRRLHQRKSSTRSPTSRNVILHRYSSSRISSIPMTMPLRKLLIKPIKWTAKELTEAAEDMNAPQAMLQLTWAGFALRNTPQIKLQHLEPLTSKWAWSLSPQQARRIRRKWAKQSE